MDVSVYLVHIVEVTMGRFLELVLFFLGIQDLVKIELGLQNTKSFERVTLAWTVATRVQDSVDIFVVFGEIGDRTWKKGGGGWG